MEHGQTQRHSHGIPGQRDPLMPFLRRFHSLGSGFCALLQLRVLFASPEHTAVKGLRKIGRPNLRPVEVFLVDYHQQGKDGTKVRAFLFAAIFFLVDKVGKPPHGLLLDARVLLRESQEQSMDSRKSFEALLARRCTFVLKEYHKGRHYLWDNVQYHIWFEVCRGRLLFLLG
jgi:hypothetical protein